MRSRRSPLGCTRASRTPSGTSSSRLTSSQRRGGASLTSSSPCTSGCGAAARSCGPHSVARSCCACSGCPQGWPAAVARRQAAARSRQPAPCNGRPCTGPTLLTAPAPACLPACLRLPAAWLLVPALHARRPRLPSGHPAGRLSGGVWGSSLMVPRTQSGHPLAPLPLAFLPHGTGRRTSRRRLWSCTTA